MSGKIATIAFCLFLSIALSSAEEIEDPGSNSKAQCLDEMISWCDDMKHSTGFSMISSNYAFFSNNVSKTYNLQCIRDIHGINCTRNNEPWFKCSQQGKLTYKGKEVSGESTEDIDDDICETKNAAFKELGLKFDKKAFDKEMEDFNERMRQFSRDMAQMGKELAGMGGSFLSNLWPFGSTRSPLWYEVNDDDDEKK